MYQISDVTPVVLKPEDIKTEDLKCLPPGISDVPVIKHENLESVGCESFVEPQIKVEPVENSVEIKTEEAKCKYETNPMDSESTAAKGRTRKVKTESADEGDNTSNLVIESVTSLNTAMTTVEHLLMMNEDILQTPTLVKTEVEEISVKDEFPDTKSETAILPSVEINPHTIDESAASGRPRRSCKRINYLKLNDVGREANDQILIPSPKKTGAKGGRKLKTTTNSVDSHTEDLARNSSMKPKFEKSPLTGEVSSNQIETCVDINEENQEEICTQDSNDEDDPDWRMDNDTGLVRNTSGISSTMRNKTKVDSLEPLSGEKSFICTVCNSKFVKSDTLKNHMRTHTGGKPYACTQCDYRCATQGGLTSPTKIHLDDKKHKCPYCDYKSGRSDDLKKHLRTHTGEKPHACTQCDYRCATQGGLTYHTKIHLGDKKHKCPYCDYKSVSSNNLKRHLRTHTGEKPHACTQCDYRCATQGGMTSHTKIHLGDKKYKCRFCDYKSVRTNDLKKHLRTHTGEKPHACTQCDYRCATQGGLTSHTKIHLGDKKHKCPYCDYKSVSSNNLKRHLSTHTGEKPHACTQCDYRCATQGGLTSHTKIHLGDKKHKCRFCDYKSVRAHDLKKHLSTHTGEKPHACTQCDYRCTTQGKLTSHTKIHLPRRQEIQVSIL